MKIKQHYFQSTSLRLFLFCLFYISCYGQSEQEISTYAKQYFKTEFDSIGKEPTLVGVASLEQLYDWKIPSSYQHYTDTVASHKNLERALVKRNKKKILVFGGLWWCVDTREIVSQLLIVSKNTSLPNDCISFVGLNREKQTAGYLNNVFSISRVPTILVLEEGKEVGRIVEYGQSGDWKTELIKLLGR